jgi:peptidoglycan hydrolase-like protein with peptidoglycan-binding domain
MKMRHVVIATSAALITTGAIAGGQQHSQSGESRSGQAQTTPQAAADSTISQAQQKLQSEGYAPTPQGLREFQQAKGIQPSGQLDEQTLVALGVGAPAASGASSESAAQPSERSKY